MFAETPKPLQTHPRIFVQALRAKHLQANGLPHKERQDVGLKLFHSHFILQRTMLLTRV